MRGRQLHLKQLTAWPHTESAAVALAGLAEAIRTAPSIASTTHLKHFEEERVGLLLLGLGLFPFNNISALIWLGGHSASLQNQQLVASGGEGLSKRKALCLASHA